MQFTAMELNRKKSPPLKSRENKESVRPDPLEPWVRDSLAFSQIPYKEFSSQPTECIKKNQLHCKARMGFCLFPGIYEIICVIITAFTGRQRLDR